MRRSKIYDKGVVALKPSDSFGEFQFNYRYGDIVAPFIDFHEPLRVEAEHFIDCVLTGTWPITDGHAGLQVVRVIEALQKSLRDPGRPVAINGSSVSRRWTATSSSARSCHERSPERTTSGVSRSPRTGHDLVIDLREHRVRTGGRHPWCGLRRSGGCRRRGP